MSQDPTSTDNFADRLLAAIDEKGSPVCVGLDPVYEKFPPELHKDAPTLEERLHATETFCGQVIRCVAPHVPAVKPQIAYFEQLGPWGLELYNSLCATARAAGLIVIGDAKRGDIGSTAQAYAAAHLVGHTGMDANHHATADALTINGYFGADGTEPFISAARKLGKGLFVLVRTSNPGGATIQDFAGPDGKKFFVHLAEQVAAMGAADGLVGRCGYSCVGAVVGATYPDEARMLRKVMPQQVFLVPGYGAQGATAADCAAAFDESGRGAIVNASRSVIYAYANDANGPWTDAVTLAAKRFADEIAAAVKQ